VVEIADAKEFYRNPRHPYSQGLLASFPTLSGPKHELTGIPGSPPDLRTLPDGCAFAARCPLAFDKCDTVVPSLFALDGRAEWRQSEAACLLYEGDGTATTTGNASTGATQPEMEDAR
jgi:oligopeptide/dipeptide ABC transporter ATP-binding protein